MVLTRQFRETVLARAQRDPKFRLEMLIEAVEEFLAGDIDMAKRILRDYINATITFEQVAKAIHKDPKSIQRMLGPKGNPSSRSLSQIFAFLQKKEKLHLYVGVG